MNLSKLPVELVFCIYEFVDYETRVSYMLNRITYLTNRRELSDTFTVKHISDIFRHCVINKLTSTVKIRNRDRRKIKPEINAMFPSSNKYIFVDQSGIQREVVKKHPVLNVLNGMRMIIVYNKKDKGKALIDMINSFKNIKSYIADIDHLLMKFAYETICTIIHYKRILDTKKQLKNIEKKQKDEIKRRHGIKNLLELFFKKRFAANKLHTAKFQALKTKIEKKIFNQTKKHIIIPHTFTIRVNA